MSTGTYILPGTVCKGAELRFAAAFVLGVISIGHFRLSRRTGALAGKLGPDRVVPSLQILDRSFL